MSAFAIEYGPLRDCNVSVDQHIQNFAEPSDLQNGYAQMWRRILRHLRPLLTLRQKSHKPPFRFSQLMYNGSKIKKKEYIWLSHMTKAPTPTEKSKKAMWQHKNATKNFDYKTIADRLRTVSWRNNSHPIGMVKPVYEHPTFSLTATAM